MRQNLDLLEKIQKYTLAHPGTAVKACTEDGHCWVYSDGEERFEPGGTAPFPAKKPGEPIEFMSLTLTEFWLGTWNGQLNRFTPKGEVLCEEDIWRRLKR